MSKRIELRLFGPNILAVDSAAITLKTRRSWALLAYLVANAKRSVPRDEIAHLLWDRSQHEQARASLRQELSNLRAALNKVGWTPLTADKNSVRFEPGDAFVDLLAFDDARAAGDAATARDLYGGAFLADLNIPSEPFESWKRAEAARLADEATSVQLNVLGDETTERPVASEPFAAAARAMLLIDRSSERAHRDLMRHYAATGRPAEALRQFKRCETALREDLDAAPSATTTALMHDLRNPNAAVVPSNRDTGPTVSSPPAMTSRVGKANASEQATSNPKPRRWGSIAVPGIVVGGLLVGATTAVAAVQYVSDGQRLTSRNLVCALPFVHRRPDDVVSIGAILPYNKEHGERLRWGIERFQRDERETYGFPFRISYENSAPGLEALPGIFRAFERERVKAVLGPLESRTAWEAKLWGNVKRVPIVSPLASAAYLTQSDGADYFFRTGMSDGVRARALVEWLRIRKLEDNPYIIHELPAEPGGPDAPEIYGQAQATAIRKQLDRFEEITFIRGDLETHEKAASQVRDDGRAVLIHGYTNNIINVVRAMQERGLRNPVFLMGVVSERLQNAGLPFPEQLHVVTGINSEARNLISSGQLRADFEAEADSDLEYDISAYYAYDAMGMILDAVATARAESCGGHASPAAVAAALRRTPAKRRKVLHSGFLPDTQEIYFESDGLRMLDGKRFVPVGIGG